MMNRRTRMMPLLMAVMVVGNNGVVQAATKTTVAIGAVAGLVLGGAIGHARGAASMQEQFAAKGAKILEGINGAIDLITRRKRYDHPRPPVTTGPGAATPDTIRIGVSGGSGDDFVEIGASPSSSKSSVLAPSALTTTLTHTEPYISPTRPKMPSVSASPSSAAPSLSSSSSSTTSSAPSSVGGPSSVPSSGLLTLSDVGLMHIVTRDLARREGEGHQLQKSYSDDTLDKLEASQTALFALAPQLKKDAPKQEEKKSRRASSDQREGTRSPAPVELKREGKGDNKDEEGTIRVNLNPSGSTPRDGGDLSGLSSEELARQVEGQQKKKSFWLFF